MKPKLAVRINKQLLLKLLPPSDSDLKRQNNERHKFDKNRTKSDKLKRIGGIGLLHADSFTQTYTATQRQLTQLTTARRRHDEGVKKRETRINAYGNEWLQMEEGATERQ